MLALGRFKDGHDPAFTKRLSDWLRRELLPFLTWDADKALFIDLSESTPETIGGAVTAGRMEAGPGAAAHPQDSAAWRSCEAGYRVRGHIDGAGKLHPWRINRERHRHTISPYETGNGGSHLLVEVSLINLKHRNIKMIVFTICSANYMSYALTLKETLEDHNKLNSFYILMCDKKGMIEDDMYDFEIIYIEDLGIPGIDNMINRYNITELNTSLKPFMFLYLFDRHPTENIIYFDPDIMIFGPLEELNYQIHLQRNCILTPHITEPAEFAEMNDQKFLTYGVYNLGFCSLRDCPQVRRVVSWWSRRLESECVIDLSRGLFVDQKWADLLPAMIDDTYILRHPGYNAAYWNLSQRRIAKKDSDWKINELDLRFFHFSGNIIEDKLIFSRHSHQFNIDTFGCMADILTMYRDKIMRNGYEYYISLEYGFSWSGISGVNEHTRYEIFRNRQKAVKNPHLYLMRNISDFKIPDNIAEARSREEKKLLNYKCDAAEGEIYCSICGKNTLFTVVSNFNECISLHCQECGFNAQFRAAFHAALQISIHSDIIIVVNGQLDESINLHFRERARNRAYADSGRILITDSDLLLDNMFRVEGKIPNNNAIIMMGEKHKDKIIEHLDVSNKIFEFSCWSKRFGYMFEKINILVVNCNKS